MKLGKLFKNKMEAKHIFYGIMVILYVYLISKCIYQYTSGAGLDACKLEFLLMVVFSLVIYVVSFLGLDLFNKNNKKTKKKKKINPLIKNSLLSSGFLSLIITTFLYLLIAYETIYIDFYNMIPNNPVLSIIGLAVLIYVVLFVALYFIHIQFLKKK